MSKSQCKHLTSMKNNLVNYLFYSVNCKIAKERGKRNAKRNIFFPSFTVLQV